MAPAGRDSPAASVLSTLPDKAPPIVEEDPAGCEQVRDDLRDGRWLEYSGEGRRELFRPVRAGVLAEKSLDREDGPGTGAAAGLPGPICLCTRGHSGSPGSGGGPRQSGRAR